jgi:hypothetical protein
VVRLSRLVAGMATRPALPVWRLSIAFGDPLLIGIARLEDAGV